MAVADKRALTVRLDEDLVADLQLIAECDGEPTVEAIRSACAAWVAIRRCDPNVREALGRRIDRAHRLLDEPRRSTEVDPKGS